MAKQKLATDEKFTNVDFNLFEALEAIDKKDYGYYDRLTLEQRKKFSAYMMIIWASSVNGANQKNQLKSVANAANPYFFDENIGKSPKLQWLLLCAASLGKGKQFHQYIPHLENKVVKLQKKAVLSEVREYFKKVHPNVDAELIEEISKLYTEQQHRKVYFAEKFPNLKFDEIDLLNELLTDEEIKKYERDYGN